MVLAWGVGSTQSRWEAMVGSVTSAAQSLSAEHLNISRLKGLNISKNPTVNNENELYTSLRTWLKVSPHTVLFVLLPPLLFEDASAIRYFVC